MVESGSELSTRKLGSRVLYERGKCMLRLVGQHELKPPSEAVGKLVRVSTPEEVDHHFFSSIAQAQC